MNSKQTYIKSFEELLQIEKKAKDLYQFYVTSLKDDFILRKFAEIYNDEIKHVKIAENILRLLQ